MATDKKAGGEDPGGLGVQELPPGRACAARSWIDACCMQDTRIEFDLRWACYQDKRPRIDWAPWGAALASLSLVASEEVAAATSRCTEAMREFKAFDLGGKRTKDDGLQPAAQVLAQAQMGFANAARRSLDYPQRRCPGSSTVPPAAPPADAGQQCQPVVRRGLPA